MLVSPTVIGGVAGIFSVNVMTLKTLDLPMYTVDSKRVNNRLLTWVGGKQLLLSQLIPLVPREYNAYYEACCGSAALFFALPITKKSVFLNDSNHAVIAVHNCVHTYATRLKQALAALQRMYNTIVDTGGEQLVRAYYKRLQGRYSRELGRKNTNPVKLAALLLFLNRTSYASLHRLNKEGKHNVPFAPPHGSLRVQFYRPAVIDAAAAHLKANDVHLSAVDFADALKTASRGDFVFLDPPYWREKPSFSYQQDQFTLDDQMRVLQVFKDLTKRGCKVLLTNVDTANVRNMYTGFRLVPLHSKQTMHANVPTHELAILNY